MKEHQEKFIRLLRTRQVVLKPKTDNRVFGVYVWRILRGKDLLKDLLDEMGYVTRYGGKRTLFTPDTELKTAMDGVVYWAAKVKGTRFLLKLPSSGLKEFPALHEFYKSAPVIPGRWAA